MKCEDVTPRQVSVLLVTHNSERVIEPCLSSLVQRMGNLSYEIVVVDNASTDDTVELIRGRFPSARVIENSENVGFGKANNQAAAVSQGSFLLLLNDDTEILEGTLESAVRYAAKNHVAILGPKTVDANGNIQRSWDDRNSIASYTGNILSMALFLQKLRRRRGHIPDAPTGVRFLVGSALLVEREAYMRHGLFDERFFFSCEERDLCLRYTQAGEKIVFFPDWMLLHHGATGRPQSRFHVENWLRSSLLFADKHGGILEKAAIRGAFLLFLLSYCGVSAAKGVFRWNGAEMRRSGLYAALFVRFPVMMFTTKRRV